MDFKNYKDYEKLIFIGWITSIIGITSQSFIGPMRWIGFIVAFAGIFIMFISFNLMVYLLFKK